MAETTKKKLGIIGGLGPAASAFFYNRITQHTMASCDQEHIDIILLSHATTPDRTQCILQGRMGRLSVPFGKMWKHWSSWAFPT